MSLPLDTMLRPPVEVYSGLIAIAAGGLALYAPSIFMMTPSVGWMTGGLLGTMGCWRIWQGSQVLRYQRNIKRLKRYSVASEDIPVFRDALFIGKGFRYTQKHTQRFKNTVHPRAHPYLTRGVLFKAARNFERHHPDHWLARLTCSESAFNPLRPDPDVGGNSALHGVEPKEQDIFVNASERVSHTLVVGTTRVGKSRLEEILIEQDIIRDDGPVICLDPKSDAGLMTRMYTAAKRAGREDEFLCFHLGFPEISARYNAVSSFSRITEVASRITGQLSGEGNSQAFREFSWRFTNIVARALVYLSEKPDYASILKYMTDIEPLFTRYAEVWLADNADADSWSIDVNNFEIEAAQQYKRNPKSAKYANPRTEALRRYIEESGVNDPTMVGLISALRYDKTFFDKLVASLLPLLEKLTTGAIGKLIAPDYFDVNDPRPIFDWMSVIRKRSIVYVGLDALSDMSVASAVGNSIFADLVSTAGVVYKHGSEYGMIDSTPGRMPKIYLHADEFSSLCGDEFIPMVNQSGGAGMRITAYTQARADLESRMGSSAKARQIESNFGNLIMLRVKEKTTAELLCDQLPDVSVNDVMTVSGASDNADVGSSQDFTSSTQDRISQSSQPLVDPSMVMALPKGQAFALINGGELYKIRIPLPKDDTIPVSQTVATLAAAMQKRYATSENWWVS